MHTCNDNISSPSELQYDSCNVGFEFTYVCNFSCDYCGVKPRLQKKIKEYDVKGAVKLLDDLINISINSSVTSFKCHILGGEPTMHPQFNEVYRSLYNKLLQYVDSFENLYFTVSTNMFSIPTIATEMEINPRINHRVTVTIHPETDIEQVISDIKRLHKINEQRGFPIHIAIKLLYGAIDPVFNSRQTRLYDTLKAIFKRHKNVYMIMDPLIGYWKNDTVAMRPDIHEVKYCKPLSLIVDDNLNVLDACDRCKPWKQWSDIKSSMKFPSEPRLCTHLCFDDHSRAVNSKMFVHSDDKNFMYFNEIPIKYRGYASD